jgi:hypothetical protein
LSDLEIPIFEYVDFLLDFYYKQPEEFLETIERFKGMSKNEILERINREKAQN